MTRDSFKKADDLVKDIDNLDRILGTLDANHWVGFVRAENTPEILGMNTYILQEDFENFIRCEKAKLMDEFEKL